MINNNMKIGKNNIVKFNEHVFVSSSGIENLSFVFSKPEKRTSWEEIFNEAKQKIGKLCLYVTINCFVG